MNIQITRFLLILLVVPTRLLWSQEAATQGLWLDYLPYSNGRDVTIYQDRIFVAVSDALFYVDKEDLSVHKFSKIQGLSDNEISSIYTDKRRNLMFIGYENGNLDILDGDEIINLPALRRSTQFQGLKRINHMVSHGDFLYMSTNFGIQTVDLRGLFFRETFIIGQGASTIEVYQTSIDAATNKIYAATEVGLLEADLSSQLIFFNNWQPTAGHPASRTTGVTQFANRIFSIVETPADPVVLVGENNDWTPLPQQNAGNVFQVDATGIGLLVVSSFNVSFYNENLELTRNITRGYWGMPETFVPRRAIVDLDTQFDDVYIADADNGLIRNWNELNTDVFAPRGPNTSSVFQMAAEDGKLVVAPGAINELWGNTFNNDGISFLESFDWTSITGDELPNIRDIISVAIDPNDPEKVYAAAWGFGVLEFQNKNFVRLWNGENTNGIIKPIPNTQTDFRVGGLSFDLEGNLWLGNSLTNAPLLVKRTNNSWEEYSFGSLADNSTGIQKVLALRGGYKMVQTRGAGLLIHSTESQNGRVLRLLSGEGNGNLPSNTVNTFAEDLNGEAWIGTASGLVILFSPESIFDPNRSIDAQPALIQVEGTFERLLGSENITAIAVDGANKKWIGTANSGVFYISADGAEIIYNFNEQNSPLFSNNIVDIAIDQESGEVFFGTARGIISFRGAATRGGTTFENVYAYPNPVRPDYDGPIAIRGLLTNAQVKITDVTGNIVFETRAEGGQASWNGRNFSGKKVASGVYLALLTNDDGSQTEVTKILIVR